MQPSQCNSGETCLTLLKACVHLMHCKLERLKCPARLLLAQSERIRASRELNGTKSELQTRRENFEIKFCPFFSSIWKARLVLNYFARDEFLTMSDIDWECKQNRWQLIGAHHQNCMSDLLPKGFDLICTIPYFWRIQMPQRSHQCNNGFGDCVDRDFFWAMPNCHFGTKYG